MLQYDLEFSELGRDQPLLRFRRKYVVYSYPLASGRLLPASFKGSVFTTEREGFLRVYLANMSAISLLKIYLSAIFS